MQNTPKPAPAKTVDEYLDALPEDVRTTLQQLRASIKSAAPDAEEVISYRIPTYRRNGRLVHFAAFKNHCSFITVSESIIDAFKQELQPYKISGTTIQFTPKNPLPESLVQRIVEARLKESQP